MIRQVILCMPILKYEGCVLDDFLPVKEAVIVLLHKLPHLVTAIEGTRHDHRKQEIII